MKVVLMVYENDKYSNNDLPIDARQVESEIKSFRIVKGGESRQIESETDGSCIDPYHEYLELTFANGTTGTFRNSFVDLFRLH